MPVHPHIKPGPPLPQKSPLLILGAPLLVLITVIACALWAVELPRLAVSAAPVGGPL